MFNYLEKHFKQIDIFPYNPIEMLNFDRKRQNKSFLGGICTCWIIIAMISIFLYSLIPIYKKENINFYHSLISSDNEEVILND